MTRRRGTILLHWLVTLLLILMMSDGERFAWLTWGFVVACLCFAAIGLVFRRTNRLLVCGMIFTGIFLSLDLQPQL